MTWFRYNRIKQQTIRIRAKARVMNRIASDNLHRRQSAPAVVSVASCAPREGFSTKQNYQDLKTLKKVRYGQLSPLSKQKC